MISSNVKNYIHDTVHPCVPQSVDMAGLKYLVTSLETLTDPDNPESESEGWLLEKGVKETFTDMLAKLKTLGKGNQVEEGGEGGATAT